MLAFADVLLNIGCACVCVWNVCVRMCLQTRPEGGQTEPEVKENRRIVVKDLTGQLMSS